MKYDKSNCLNREIIKALFEDKGFKCEIKGSLFITKENFSMRIPIIDDYWHVISFEFEGMNYLIQDSDKLKDWKLKVDHITKLTA